MCRWLCCSLLVLACAVPLSTCAFATENVWTIFVMAASAGPYGEYIGVGSEAWAASRTTATVQDDPATKDTVDGTVVPPAVAPVAFAQWYRPWQSDGSYGFFTRDAKRPLNTVPELTKRWDDLLVWASDGSGTYTSPDIKLFISGSGVPNSVGSIAINYTLLLTQAPEGYSGPTEWTLPAYPSPGTTTKTFWYEITLPSSGSITPNPVEGTGALAAVQTAGYRFSLLVGPLSGFDTFVTGGVADGAFTSETAVTFTFCGWYGVSPTSSLTYSTKLDSGAWTEFNPATATTYDGLAQGQHTFQVKARATDGTEDPSPASITWTIDSTPPAPPVVVDDGVTTSSETELHAAWSATDAESGIHEYRYAIGTTPTDPGAGYLRDWTSAGSGVEAIDTELSLVGGQTYYWYVQAKNRAGLWSSTGSSDGIVKLDTSPPPAPAVSDDGAFTLSPNELRASWLAEDAESGISEYRYAIGTSPNDPGAGYVAGWTSAGASLQVEVIGLDLEPGNTYYWYVRARNGVGLWSAVGVSNGVVCAPLVANLGETKQLGPGGAFTVERVVASTGSADFAPHIFVQDSRRAAGVRLNIQETVNRGDRLTFAGRLKRVDGEWQIDLLDGPEVVAGPEPVPLLITGHALVDLNEDLIAESGLDATGLLVKIVGKITRINTGQHVFYVNDGSDLADGMGPSDGPYVGIRVSYRTFTPPAVGKRVLVTGILRIEKATLAEDAFVNGEYRHAGETLYLPVVCPRAAADIVVLL